MPRKRTPNLTAGRPADAYLRVNTARLADAVYWSGMTQAELARKAKVSPTLLSFLITGKRTTCKQETGQRIWEALGMKDRPGAKSMFSVHWIDRDAQAPLTRAA